VPGRVRQSVLESDEAVVIGPPPVPGDAAGLTFPYDQRKDVPAAEKVGTCSLHTFALRLNLTVHCESKKQDTKLLHITSPNINRFSKFFYC